jgi:hypothetical protein
MFVLRAYTVFLLAVLPLAAPAFAAPPKAAQAPRPKARQQNAPPKPDNHPGEQLFTRLERMTPEQREKALSQLPPARRAQIEKRIQNFQKLPPAVQERRLDRLERLNSLPPREQAQVRRSVNQLQNLPDDRRRAINQELRRMSAMPEDERQAYMNTEEFRNRFSPSEQQIVSDAAKIE